MRARDPLIALILTFLCPGLGHVYLRLYGKAILFFLAMNSLYFLGILLGGPTIFAQSGSAEAAAQGSQLLVILRAPLPEALNFVATAMASYHYMQRALILVPGEFPLATAGTILSAMSGMLSIFAMSDAWTAAFAPRNPGIHVPARAALLSWLLPGLGHWFLGKRFKAVFCFAVIQLLYFSGLFLSHGLVVNREKYFYYWGAQLFNGATTAIVGIITQDWRRNADIESLELGLLYTTVAGLLNILVIVSAYTTAKGEKP